jgi:transposase
MITIGIDVSKTKLDCAWLRDPVNRKVKNRTFENTPKGFQALIDWASTSTQAPIEEAHFILEATGIYHEALAYALYQAGARVSVVNPVQIKRYAESFGRRSKTDKKDSVMIALYGASQQPRLWQPEPTEIRVLKALIARLEAVEKDIQREQNRLEKAAISQASEAVATSIQTILAHLEVEKNRLLKLIDEHIDQYPNLKSDRKLLETIPGIGPVMTRYMMAMLRSRDFDSASQAGAYVGLVPVHHESGSSVRVKPRISKTGNAAIRAKLYMAAVVAIQHNPDIRAQYQRLLKHGKSKMSALIAAMRKLVHICFGVLKHQKPFQAQTIINGCA